MGIIQITAVGDISFEGRNAEHPNQEVFSAVAPLLKNADISIGNLENPLIDSGVPVPGKCTLHGHTGWADVLKASGFTVMSLANNHMMDYGQSGITSTLRALSEAGLSFVGAGMNEAEALAPLIVEIKTKKLALLARSSVEVASHCYAKGGEPGVAHLDLDELSVTSRRLRNEVDYIILCIHWGLEEYSLPTIRQRKEAFTLISSGFDCIIGHHPHVLQGIEIINKKPVLYSLGNFKFDDFTWQYKNLENQVINLHIKPSIQNRIGLIVALELNNENITIKDKVTTYYGFDNSMVCQRPPTNDGNKIERLSNTFNIPFYNFRWRFYSIRKEWEIRIGHNLSPIKVVKKFSKIRLYHIKMMFRSIITSFRIVLGKSTNPYE